MGVRPVSLLLGAPPTIPARRSPCYSPSYFQFEEKLTAMVSRRSFILAVVGAPLAGCNTVRSDGPTITVTDLVDPAARLLSDPEHTAGVDRSRSELARKTVSYRGVEHFGTIVVKTSERRLYLVLADRRAIRYSVGVGRDGKKWQGRAAIDGKHVEPAWSPPEEIKRDNPRLPDVIAGGSPRNPMGPRALTLSGGGQYAIHGTNRPNTVGTFATYGCIRMFNEDIVDLFDRVAVGTEVVVDG